MKGFLITATALILLSGCATPEPEPPPIKGRYCNPDNPAGICCAQSYTAEQRRHLRDQCP